MRPNHPQRIARPSMPGERLKRPMSFTRKVRLREAAGRDLTYLANVRRCPCLGCGFDLGCEAAHLRASSGAHGKASGIGKKPDDKWALSLCLGCHAEQHAIGEREFWSTIGLNPFLVAERLYEARGDLVAMRAVIMYATARRGRASGTFA